MIIYPLAEMDKSLAFKDKSATDYSCNFAFQKRDGRQVFVTSFTRDEFIQHYMCARSFGFSFHVKTTLLPIIVPIGLQSILPLSATAQQIKKLSLPAAVQTGMQNNLQLHTARVSEQITATKLAEAEEQILPEINFHSSYARITKLTEYQSGLNHKVVYKTIPDAADISANATLPLYAGGAIKNSIKKAAVEKELSALQTQKTARQIQLEITAHFLGITKQMLLQSLLKESIKEGEERLKEVKAFKKHGTVTGNEILRAEVLLADRRLALLTNTNRMDINIHNLETLLQLPHEDSLVLDTATIVQNYLPIPDYAYLLQQALHTEEVKMAYKQEDILKIDKAITKANYYPRINFYSSYTFSYPNYVFFPVDPYWYNLGKAGVEMVFNLSGLYKNKTRMLLASQKIEQQHIVAKQVEDAVDDEVYRYFTEYKEALERIPVTKKTETEASENYRIIKLKYLNQLALITDIVDADNTLLAARFATAAARVDAWMKYYELQFACGYSFTNSQ